MATYDDELAIGRTEAETMMRDEVTVKRPDAIRSAARVDEATGQTLRTYTAVADGGTVGTDGRSLAGPEGVGLKCWVRSTADSSGTPAERTAEQWATVRVHIPWDAPLLNPGDVVTVARSASPRLQGADIVVVGEIARTREISARYIGQYRRPAAN